MSKSPKVFRALNRHITNRLSRYAIVALILSVIGVTALLSLIAPVRSLLVTLSGNGPHAGNYVWRALNAQTITIFTLSALVVGLAIYSIIDYRAHRRPLKEADPEVAYSFAHHLRVVSMPLLSYKWRSVAKAAGIVGLIMVAFIATAVFTGLFTEAANTISVTINEKPGSSITSPVFSVVFSQPINASTFTDDDVNLTGTAQNMRVTGITQVAPNDNTTFEVTVTADSTGNITATIPAANITYTVQGGISYGKTGDVPYDIVADSSGNSFMATDKGIVKIAANGTYSSFANIGNVYGIAVDSSNNLYARLQDSIEKITPDGTVTNLGSAGNGGTPITVDANGTVYTSDYFDGNITKITSDGTDSTYASLGSDYLSRFPHTIAADIAGNVYAVDTTDTNNIIKIDATGTSSTLATLSGHATSIVLGQDGYLYVSEYDNKTVYKVSTSGAVTTLGTTTGFPRYITMNSQGDVFTTDFSGSSGHSDLNKIAADGTSSTIFDNCCQLGTEFEAVSTNSDGTFIALSDGSANYYRITANGQVTKFGTPGSNPVDEAIDTNGNIYTVNSGSDNVSKITPDGTSTIFATLPHGGTKITYGKDGNIYVYAPYEPYVNNFITKITPSGSVSTINNLNDYNVYKMVVASDGTIYDIVGSYQKVVKITSDGTASDFVDLHSYPNAITLDNSDNVFVSCNSGVSPYGSTISEITPGGVVTSVGSDPNIINTLVVNSAEDIYVGTFNESDSKGYVAKINPGGSSTTLVSTFDTENTPDGVQTLRLDGEDNVYALTYADYVYRISFDDIVYPIPPTSIGGFAPENGFVVDSLGNLYGALGQGNRVDKAFIRKLGAYDTNKNGNQDSTSTDNTVFVAPPVTNLSTQYVASNTVSLAWTDPQTGQGDGIYDHVVEYKKHSDSTWQTVNDVENQGANSANIFNLEPSTDYDFRVAAIVTSQENHQTDWANLSATTTAQQTIHISNCVQLQSIAVNPLTLDLVHGIYDVGDASAHYVLDQDIDCADAANWTWLAGTPYEFHGFLPLAGFVKDVPFTGSLDGQGHTIKNLVLPTSSYTASNPLFAGLAPEGLFRELEYATVQNLKLQNFSLSVSDIPGPRGNPVVPFTPSNGLLAGLAVNSTVTNVSVNGAITTGDSPFPSGPAYNRGSSTNNIPPVSMATDSHGNTYVLSDYTVRKLDPNGNLVRMWDVHNEGSGNSATLFNASDIAIDSSDNVFIAVTSAQDNLGNPQIDRIQHYDTNGNYLGAFGETGTNPGQLYMVADLAVSGNYIYALDGNSHITRFDSDGSNPISWSVTLSSSIFDLDNPNLLAADDNGHVFYLNPESKVMTRYDSDGSNPLTFTTNAQSSANTYYGSSAIGLDAAGHVYVSSSNSSFALERFDNDGSNPTTWATDLWNNGPLDSNGLYTGFNSISSITPSGSGLAIFYDRDAHNGSMAGVMHLDQTGSRLTDWTNLVTDTGTNTLPTIGGLIGTATSSTITKVSSSVNINLNGTVYQMMSIGGLVGAIVPLGTGPQFTDPYITTIANSYFDGSITINNGGLISAGGLIGSMDGGLGYYYPGIAFDVENSYSAGSISLHDQAKYLAAGGIVSLAEAFTPDDTIKNVFSTTTITGAQYQNSDFPNSSISQDGFSNTKVGSVTAFFLHLPSAGTVTNNFYDQTSTGQTDCMQLFTASTNGDVTLDSLPNGACTAVNANGSQPDYFKYNYTNGPLGSWDFTSIWRTNENRLPSLGANTAPSVPQAFNGSPSKTTVNLSWQAPADNGGRPLIDYTIQYRQAGDPTWQTLTHSPSTSTSYEISNLTSGVTYQFQVAAVNEIGESSFVLGTSVTTSDVTSSNPPAPPTIPKKTTPGSQKAVTATPLPSSPPSASQPGTLVPEKVPRLKPVTKSALPKKGLSDKVAFGISWLLLAVLLVIASIYGYRARREYTTRKRLEAAAIRLQATHQALKNFIDISSHYLRTPLAIMNGSLELLGSSKQVPSVILSNIQLKLKHYAGSVQELALQSSVQPSSESVVGEVSIMSKNAMKQAAVWVPLAVVSISFALVTFLFTHQHIYALASVQVGLQILCLVLISGLLVLAYHNRRVQLAAQAKAQAAIRLRQSLVEERATFIQKATGVLADDYESINLASQDLKTIDQAKTFFNGLAMLHSLTMSLGNVQRFTTLSPDAPQLDLAVESSRVMTNLQAQANEKHVTVSSGVSDNLKVQLQPEELQQLLQSLVRNAVMFSAEGGNVVVGGRQTRGAIELTVSDHGTGMASDQVEHLFEPFSQAGEAQTVNHTGLGMNLHIDKLILDKVGGSIKVESSNLTGKSGTMVTVRFPRPVAGSHPSPILVAPTVSPPTL